MSDRINLTELRQHPERVWSRAQKLALVETVEAAKELDDDMGTVMDEPRMSYMEVQIGRARVNNLRDKLARFSFGDNTYTPEDHASSQAARRYENHLEQIKDHGP